MIGIELELRHVLLIVAEAEELLHRRMTVCAVHPFAASAPAKFRGFRLCGQRLAGAKQRFDVNAIVDFLAGLGHVLAPFRSLHHWSSARSNHGSRLLAMLVGGVSVGCAI